ncbi:outer membrane protein assembly factor BamA, partial [Candidatus Pacearchaeota archaeon]
MFFKFLSFLFLLSQYVIKDIKVEGNAWSDVSYILSLCGLRVGDTIYRDNISRAVKNLYQASDRYEDILILGRVFGKNEIGLIIKVKENPKIFDFRIETKRKLKKKEIKKAIGRVRGQFLSKRKIFEWKKKISEIAKKKGYPFPLIKVIADTIVKNGKKGVKVKIKVEAGEKRKVKKIEFEGNKNVPDEKLKKVMKTKERASFFVARLWRSGKFDEDKFYEDLKRIEEYYHNNGFPEAKVDSFKLDTLKGYIFIKIFVSEGKKYYWGNFKFVGNKVFEDSVLKNVLKIKKGKLYSQKKLQETLMEIYGLYGDKGYIFAQVFPDIKMREKDTFDVVFRIQEGHRVKIRKIEIKGNRKTYEEVIRRELDIFPGQYFNRSLVLKSQRDLWFLNYFQNVKVNYKPTEDSNYVDLVFEVEEKQTATLGLGATYSQIDKLSFYLRTSIPNFMGKGQSVSLLAEYGIYRKNFQFSFTEPWLFGKPRLLGFSIYYLTSYTPGYYWSDRQGFNVTYKQYLFNDYWRAGWTYRLERKRIRDVMSSSYEDYLRSRGYSINKFQFLHSITPQITFDNRDRVFNPSKGRRFEYSVEFAGRFVIGDVKYHKHLVEYRRIFAFADRGKWNKLRFMYRFRSGFIGSYKDVSEIPPYERFMLGGVGFYGLRGYDFYDIGPVSKGIVVGGRFFTVLTFELRYSLVDNVYLLAFLDVGNCWEDPYNLGLDDFKNLKRGVGVGVRAELPMLGIVGFDIGYGLDEPNKGGI